MIARSDQLGLAASTEQGRLRASRRSAATSGRCLSGSPFQAEFARAQAAEYSAPGDHDGAKRRIMIASLRYLDTFVKRDGAWLFAERKLYVDWVDDRDLS